MSSIGVNTVILDTTKNRNSYYIYTKNEEELRNIAAHSIEGLTQGITKGISVNKNLTVYTSLPDENEYIYEVDKILPGFETQENEEENTILPGFEETENTEEDTIHKKHT